MKKKTYLALSLALLLLLASACGSSGSAGAPPYGGTPSASTPSEEYWPDAEPQEPGDADFGYGGESMDSAVYQNPNAKLIRRAELHIQTEQFDQSREALNKLVGDCGGYFESASVYGGSRRDAFASRSGEYVVRVPSEKFSQFFSGAGDLGYVTNSTESSEDVGTQYYDLEARLKTQRTKQDRLLALLEKAETMEDIIALESALSEVEYQIESYSSELNRYDELIGFSTFRIYLSEVGKVTQEVGNTASLGAQMLAGIQSSFQGLVQGGQGFLVWVSYNLFLALFLAAGIAAAAVVGVRKLKREKREKQDEKKEG